MRTHAVCSSSHAVIHYITGLANPDSSLHIVLHHQICCNPPDPVPSQTSYFVSYECDDQVGISIVAESRLLATSSIRQILPCYGSYLPWSVILYMSIGRVLIVSILFFLVPIHILYFLLEWCWSFRSRSRTSFAQK